MLVGSAEVASLADGAATIRAFLSEPVQLTDVACFQMTVEMRNRAREAVLPPALHPTVPPTLGFQVWQVADSPWGDFSMALTRVSCRSGVRARGFTSAVVASTAEATEALRSELGFPVRLGEVKLRRGYDSVEVVVTLDGRTVLAISALDPEPMELNDVQYTGTLNLAHTPLGLRLVQIEARHQATRVERLTSRLVSFDAAAWGNALFDPYHVVSATVALESVDFLPVRFVCKPDELAFTGTESLASATQK